MSDEQDNQPTGYRYWRSLEEYADSPAFRERLEREFESYDPDEILEGPSGVSRRNFMKLAGASMALAGLTLSGCRRWPTEKLAPFAHRPEGRNPGTWHYYATLFERGGVATGLLIKSFDGRPIKVEGNPQHPFSLGATDAQQQAATLELYDPARSRTVRMRAGAANAGEKFGSRHERSTWEAFEKFIQGQAQAAGGLAILAEASSSPSLSRLKAQLLKKHPGAKWYQYEPINRDQELAGSRMVFGKALRPQYDLSKAKVIACFDSDLINGHPAALRHARQWADGRRSVDTTGEMNRMYVVESTLTCTGSVADERLPVRSGQIGPILRAMAGDLGVAGIGKVAPPVAVPFWQQLLGDLKGAKASGGQSLIVAGPNQPAEVHALVWQINAALGNFGKTISMVEEPDEGDGDISQLVQAMNAGQVGTLIIVGGNPVYDAPADLNFSAALAKVKHAAHLSLYFDETSNQCHWHLPRAHWLESWGDGRAWDGTVSVQQPLILPLFDGKSPIELLALMLGGTERESYDLVRTTYRQRLAAKGNGASWQKEDEFERAWRKVLHDGLIEGSAFKPVQATPKTTAIPAAGEPALAGKGDQGDSKSFEITFQPHAGLYDGRYANSGWLMEMPGPIDKLTWDNAAWLNIADARALGIEEGHMVSVTLGGQKIVLPAYLMPGQARGSVALPLGFGRNAQTLTVGHGVGASVYPLRTAKAMGFTAGAVIARAPGSTNLATTQHNHLLGAVGRWGLETRVGHKGKSGLIIKDGSLADYKADPGFAKKGEPGDLSLQMFEPVMKFRDPHAWGMSVDMNACTGCSACVIACQAENNIPVVGKSQVNTGREMQWLRIDRYFKTDYESDPNAEYPQLVHQPMMCVQCENAPCEEVCPVAATMHDSEGLNVMVYNRCVGVRYCSNNCPYKVRRFNFFDFHSKPVRQNWDHPWLGFPDTEQAAKVNPIHELVFNPDVTVRMRGVMEKCTYCIQRIKETEIKANREWHRQERESPLVQDGEIATACQQACPTQAIWFGNLNDKDSRVTKLHLNPRSYEVLEELNTRPRTWHMAKIRNPAKA